MNICKICNISTTYVMSFSHDKHERFCKCPRCYSETKHQKLYASELDFREIFHREMNKK